MGGIAGIFQAQMPKPVDPARVEAMTAALAHRGPDGGGVWTAPGVGLGQRLTVAGGASAEDPRPIGDSDRRTAIAFDGAIYNRREIRAELESRGQAFRTGLDGELVLAAWRQWGPDGLHRLAGTFAFALYDAGRDALFLARDRLGEKPLFHAELSDGTFLFASELKALLAHPRLRRTPSPQAVEDFLALGYVPDDASLVEGVHKLPAAHCLLVSRGKGVPAPIRWWDVDFLARQGASIRALEAELIHRLGAAVRSRMTADVPVGAFLCGAIDSSAVVAFMAEASRRAVETVSVGVHSAGSDEARRTARVAELFATRHRGETLAADDLSLLDALVDAFDEPFADTASLVTFRRSALAREGMAVALCGEGADEVLGGHPRYRLFMAVERARRWVPRGIAQGLGASRRFPAELRALAVSSGEAYARASPAFSSTRSHIYDANFTSSLQRHRAEDRYSRAFAEAPAADSLSRAQYADLRIRLPGEILTRIDRASAAAGLEVRTPFLDHDLIAFAARLPVRMRVRGSTGKWLLRRALRDRLPAEILDPRQGPEVAGSVSDWLRGPLAAEAGALAYGSALAETGWFDCAAVARLADEHVHLVADHGQLIWRLVMLERSLQRLFGIGRSRKKPPEGRRVPVGSFVRRRDRLSGEPVASAPPDARHEGSR